MAFIIRAYWLLFHIWHYCSDIILLSSSFWAAVCCLYSTWVLKTYMHLPVRVIGWFMKNLKRVYGWKRKTEYSLSINYTVFLLCQRQNGEINANTSHLITGSSSTYPNFSFGWVNVKDVALAHILAYEVPSAYGRYCMVERVVHYSEVVNIIRKMYPTIPLADK